MIRTVVFDIGEVLMRFDWSNWAAGVFGEEKRDLLDRVFWGTGYADELDRGTWTVIHFLAKCIERMPEEEALIREATARVGECMYPCDYAIGWIRELKARGYRVLYLSNYSYYLKRVKPEVLNFLPYMDGGVFSCEAKMIKPDAGIYAKLCADYDLDPAECLFIDDRKVNVEAARAYGMHAIRFENYEKTHTVVDRLLSRSRAGRPLVGVLPLWDEEKQSLWMLPGYMDGILACGGLPVMLPLTDDPAVIRQLAEQCDAFLFTGGQDVDPYVYEQEARVDNIVTCKLRDRMEEKLLEILLEEDKPILGICRGLQLINGALAGDLYQDLPQEHPSEISHRMQPPYDAPWHTVKVVRGTPLFDLLGVEELAVNSRHHQAVRKLSPVLRMMAQSPDGLCEAAWMPGKKFLWAVQWHPEHSFLTDNASRRIIQALLDAVD